MTAPIQMNECNTFDPPSGTFGPVKTYMSEDNVAWRVALGYELNDDTLLFASVTRGYKSGSTPVNAANISTQNFPATQEQLTSYELGVKAALADRAFNVNLTGFYYDYRDKQLSIYFADPIYTTLLRLDNVPKSRAYGIDGDISWTIIPELTLNVAGTWLKTEIQGFEGIDAAGKPLDYDGYTFPLSPEWSGSASIMWNSDINDSLGFRAILSGRYQSESKNALQPSEIMDMRSYGLLNGSIAIYSQKGWELSVWGQNLTDKYYWVSGATNANLAVRFPGRPRTFGLTAKMNFD